MRLEINEEIKTKNREISNVFRVSWVISVKSQLVVSYYRRELRYVLSSLLLFFVLNTMACSATCGPRRTPDSLDSSRTGRTST